jgi:hypothetical protein
MTEVEFSRLLSDLSQTAKTLNQESDSINELIGRFEDMLEKTNLGLEVWLTDPLESVPWTEEDQHTGETIGRGSNDIQLGFAKFRDKWQLVTRHATYRRSGISWELSSSSQPHKALREESRERRIAALERFPALAQQMKQAADTAVQTIQRAKKFVK